MNQTKKIKRRYNRVSGIYDWMEIPMEKFMFSGWRKKLAGQAIGRTLEVGVGTGKNIPWYPEDVHLTAIDFSPDMLRKARQKYDDDPRVITFLEMDVQDMDFDNETFDTVVTSYVFCSVPDPAKGLKEIYRVLKPGGQLLMLEHVRSQHWLTGKLMDVFNFFPLHLWGANINRNTLENVRKAGFENIEATYLRKDIFLLITAIK
jgi:ubiquinone/menaquinone biosynthesis C-methylase UbiE